MEEADASFAGLIRNPGYIANKERVTDPLWTSFLTMDSYDPISNQMLLMEKYELAFGIQNPENPSPLSLVTLNPLTDIVNNSLLDRTYQKLIAIKAPSVTGMSIKELLALPTYELKLIVRSIVNNLPKPKRRRKVAKSELNNITDALLDQDMQ